jgi:hypothetical protein
MNFKYKGLAIVLTMVVLITMFVAGVSAGAPQAADAVTGVVDRASLVRTQDGLSLTLTASELTPGHTVTAWFIVVGSPEDVVVCNVSGHRVGASGIANFGSHLGPNDPENVCFIASSGEPAGTIDTTTYVEIHVVDHGPQTLTAQELIDSMNDFVTGSECPGPGIDTCPAVGIAKFNAP